MPQNPSNVIAPRTVRPPPPPHPFYSGVALRHTGGARPLPPLLSSARKRNPPPPHSPLTTPQYVRPRWQTREFVLITLHANYILPPPPPPRFHDDSQKRRWRHGGGGYVSLTKMCTSYVQSVLWRDGAKTEWQKHAFQNEFQPAHTRTLKIQARCPLTLNTMFNCGIAIIVFVYLRTRVSKSYILLDSRTELEENMATDLNTQ